MTGVRIRHHAVRLLAAGVLLAGAVGVAAVTSPAQAAPTVCAPTNAVPKGAGGIDVHDGAQTCATPRRTLVFVGEAVIDNGVNFAGTGSPVGPTGVTGGGSYVYTGGGNKPGGCVMVNWDSPNGSAPIVTGVTNCFFTSGADGRYYGPATADPVIKNTVGTNSPLFPVLGWAPDGSGSQPSTKQANCFNSSGDGDATFTTQQVAGGTETWTSTYSWRNSLNNLRGSITGPAGTFKFDAKIRADASPLAPEPLDKHASGCLQKNVTQALSQPHNPRTGLNNILIVGTATWDVSTVTLFP